MNTEQRQDLLNAIAEFKKTDFYTPFKEKLKETTSIDSMRFGDYSIEELFTTANKSVLLLENFIKKDTWQPLQNTIIISSYNNCTLASLVRRIASHFISTDYYQAATETNRLVHYEQQNGFWNRNKRTGSDTNQATLNALEKKALLTLSHIAARKEKIENLIDKLEAGEKKIDSLIHTQNEEIKKAQQDKEVSTQPKALYNWPGGAAICPVFKGRLSCRPYPLR